MTELAAMWKHAKDTFERTTGKKKPSESVLGFFSKGSGVGDALKKADKAWDDAAKFKTAAGDFRKKSTAYKKTLKAAMEKDDKGHPAIKSLVVDLDLIGDQITAREQVLDRAAEAAEKRKQFDKAVEKHLKQLTVEKIRADRALLDAFREHVKAEFSSENLKFLDAVDAGKPGAEIYEKYVAAGAPLQVNLPGKVRTEADAANEAGEIGRFDWSKSRKEILAMMNKDTKVRFVGSERAKLAVRKKFAAQFGVELDG